jgi:hypothetical protein
MDKKTVRGPMLHGPEIYSSGQQLRPVHDMVEYVREYAREKPEVVALWCLGIGFVLGWKLKPW